MRPEYGDSDDDTDEEYDATTGELIDDAEKSLLLSAEAKAAKTARETHTTATVVHDAMVASSGLPTWLVYHDGGYTPAETLADREQREARWNVALAANKTLNELDRPCTSPLAPEKEDWGYWARYYDVAPNMVAVDPQPNDASPMIFRDKSFGQVQLEEMAEDYSGCVELMLRWRRWRHNAVDMARRGYDHLPVG